jgi:peptidyl-tRNA hydrolase, PTH1 family
MVVVAGLGNPGRKYAKTRHNIGFRVVERLSDELGIELAERELYTLGSGAVVGEEIVLLKPLTFMNRSGMAVRHVLSRVGIPAEEARNSLIVVHDDLDIDTGVIRVRRNGSSGGHKGVESIIHAIGNRDFIRVKIGIGRDRTVPAEEYVLCTFRGDEKDLTERAIVDAADAVTMIIRSGVERAMEKFNRSTGKQTSGEA